MTALMLPIGKGDWNEGNCSRLDFLFKHLPRLQAFGWTIGVDLKGGDISWADDIARVIREVGGVLTWHPSLYPTLGWGSTEFTLSDTLLDWADQACWAKELLGLQLLNLHLGAPQYTKSAPKGDDRYKSRLTAAEMVAVIKAHVPLLKEMNELCGGILAIENVHPYLYNDEVNAPEYYTYYAAQIGAWFDLPWLAKKTGVMTCVDMEHFLGSSDFFLHEYEFDGVEHIPMPKSKPMTFLQASFEPEKPLSQIRKIAGYEVKKGYAPETMFNPPYDDYMEECAPRLLHLGTADKAIENGQCADHREFNIADEIEKKLLRAQLDYAEDNDVIGCVIEACGWGEVGFNWTKENRAESADDAKLNAFASVAALLGEMHS